MKKYLEFVYYYFDKSQCCFTCKLIKQFYHKGSFQLTDLKPNIFLRLRSGLMNSINDYLRLKIVIDLISLHTTLI